MTADRQTTIEKNGRDNIEIRISQDSYDISTSVDVTSTPTRFSISDSIYRLYPEIEFVFSDYEGVLTESRSLNMGSRIAIWFSDVDQSNVSDPRLRSYYHTDSRVISSEASTQLNQGEYSGDVHVCARNQLVSRARGCLVYDLETYPNTQSVLESMLRHETIGGTDLRFSNMAQTYDVALYTHSQSFEEIVENSILPLSLNKTKNEPSYCFIDLTDTLVFSPLSGLTARDSIPVCYLMKNIPNLHSRERSEFVDSYGDTPLYSLFPFTSEYDRYSGLVDLSYSYLAEGDYDSLHQVDLSLGLESTRLRPLPLYTRLYYSPVLGTNGYEFSDEVQKNRGISLMEYSRRKNVFGEHLQVSTPLNFELHAGTYVEIRYVEYNGRVLNSSTNLVGRWIVESSRHIWEGKKQIGISTLTLGRICTTYSYSSRNVYQGYYRESGSTGTVSIGSGRQEGKGNIR